MKKNKTVPIQITEEDIRAYAAHLYEQSGGMRDRDVENWLEAERCLRTSVTTPAQLAQYRRHLAKHGTPLGFTMPPSDASLDVEEAGCSGELPTDREDKPA